MTGNPCAWSPVFNLVPQTMCRMPGVGMQATHRRVQNSVCMFCNAGQETRLLNQSIEIDARETREPRKFPGLVATKALDRDCWSSSSRHTLLQSST
eukprot:356554-Amphidinium_carterae.1